MLVLNPRPWSPDAPPRRRQLFAWLPLATLPVALLVMVVWRRGYDFVLREDRVAEWLTVLVYLAAAGVAVRVAVALRRRARLPAGLYLLLAVGLVLVAGEEVSWLGRYALHAVYVAVGLYGAGLARVLVPRVPGLRDHPHLYAPAPVLAGWFACAPVYYVYVDYVNPLVVGALGPSVDIEEARRLQEAPEFVLALGFLWFLLMAADSVTGRAGSRASAYPGDDARPVTAAGTTAGRDSRTARRGQRV